MKHMRCLFFPAVICAAIIVAAGCGSKAAKVSQGLTPVVVNFYVVNQDLDHARQAVKDDVPAQADQQLKAYAEVIAHLQSMAGDIARDPEARKKPELQALIDSCVAADTVFLGLEAAAVDCRAASARLGKQIDDIEQRSRGNTIKARQYQAELGGLELQRRAQQATLGGLLPRVTGAAAQCRSLLLRYNEFAAGAKLIGYFNGAAIFEPFAWEQAAPGHAKTAAKPRHAAAAKHRRPKR